jgi:LPS sulfotransferase NodH
MNNTMIKQELHKTIRKMRNIKQQWHPYLRNLALDTGIMGGSKTYAKFVVLGRSRVGSNLLLSLLNAHSRVVAFGEILGDPNNINVKIPVDIQSIRTFTSMPKDPVRFLEKEVFRTFPAHISAVGFKIFYYHAQSASWKPVWTYLETHKILRIVHIKRQNILKTHLSRKRAEKTSAWIKTSSANAETTAIPLSYEECLNDFVKTQEWEKQYDLLFENHCKLDVLYEDLAHDYEGEMRQIFAFLDVDYERVEPATYKQTNQPLSKAIINYFELKEQFQGTPWAAFFED